MATDYPIEITDPDGSVRFAGLADFTDSDNQPAQGGALEPPLVVPEAGTTVLVTDTPDGDALLAWDADTNTFVAQGSFTTSADITAGGTLDGMSLGHTIGYVTVQAGPPDPIDAYLTPLIFDTTAVTGGLYAWDSAQYQQVGGPLA